MTAEASLISGDLLVTALVTRARNGDKQAWDALVERYAPLIWSICRSHQLGGSDAQDVGQGVWLQLVDQLDRIRDPVALPGWLATTTRRECLRVLRASRRSPAAGHVPDAEAIPTSWPRRQSRSCWQPSATRRCTRRSPACPPAASS